MGANGVTVGDNLRFVSALPQTPPSPESGWEVDIHQVATRASKEGTVPITVENIADGLFMVISEGGKTPPWIPEKDKSQKIFSKLSRTRGKIHPGSSLMRWKLL